MELSYKPWDPSPHGWQPPAELLLSSGTPRTVGDCNVVVNHRELYKAEEKQKRNVKEDDYERKNRQD